MANDAQSFWRPANKIEPVGNISLTNLPELSPDSIAEYLLREKHVRFRRPHYTRLPFAYYHIPVSVRNALFKKSSRAPAGFPAWPLDSTADAVRTPSGSFRHISFWPKGRKFAVLLTHDIETKDGFDGIQSLRDIEKKHAMPSAWNVIPFTRYKPDFRKLRMLQDEGCEIGLHGYDHSGRLPFMHPEKMRKMLISGKERLEKEGLKVTSFRSPQLLKSDALMHGLSMLFKADSSVPNSDVNAPAALNRGCCTFFPYFIGRMVELPLTLPQDFRLIYTKGMGPKALLDLWKDCIRRIAAEGGLVTLLTHPDSYLFGDKKYHGIYDDLLAFIRKQDPWIATPTQAADWWRIRSGLTIDKGKLKGHLSRGVSAKIVTRRIR